MKKKKLSKKQTLMYGIIFSLLAFAWIYDAVRYAEIYFRFREDVGGMPSLELKVAAAITWSIAAIVWIVRYIRYDE